MYWPITTARRLHLSPSGLDKTRIEDSAADEGADEERIVHFGRSRNGHLWAAVSAKTLSVWNTRPSQAIAALVRTRRSLKEYGNNTRVSWNEDGLGIVVETDQSYLLLYTLVFLDEPIYSYVPSTGSGAKSKNKEPYAPNPAALSTSFAAGPGEGTGAMATELRGAGNMAGSQGPGEGEQTTAEIRFKLVLRIDAGLSCALPTNAYLLVATKSPPAIQCIPWPDDSPSSASARPTTKTSLLSRLDWVIKSGAEGLTSSASSESFASTSKSSSAVEQVHIREMYHSRAMDVFVWLTSDGRAYSANLELDSRTSIWRGKCFHGEPRRRRRRRSSALVGRDVSLDGTGLPPAISDPSITNTSFGDTIEKEDLDSQADADEHTKLLPQEWTTCASINAKFSLISVGLRNGTVAMYNYRAPGKTPLFSHSLSIRKALRSTASYLTTGPVRCLSWSSDGHAIAVGWERGFAVWSTYGKLMGCSLVESWDNVSRNFSDRFMWGVNGMFWGPGNTELFLLCPQNDRPQIYDHTRSAREDVIENGTAGSTLLDVDAQLFVLPFAKSAVASQHSPDNTRYAFIQLDDSVLVYRGSDQPDMSIINPESDVWQTIKIPQAYLAANWPIRYACISSDGRLIAVAGRRGLAHFSSLSGRWKTFDNSAHEQSFAVRGGLQWYQHVLVAACQTANDFELRLYSRDSPLDNASVLYTEKLPSEVILTSLFDNSLLVYTADNTLYHFLIAITTHEIKLTLCGSIAFDGVVGEPARVRGMSWLIPHSQQRFGDPMDDLTMATVIFLIDGKLVLLRPRKAGEDLEEVSYDMQILGDQIEYYWTHLQGIGTLENSLWGYDGRGIKLWLNALTIEQAELRDDDDDDVDGEDADEDRPEYKTIEESVSMPLDFYPLCVLIEKGIVIGVEPEVSLRRNVEFAIFRSATNTHLFLHHVLRSHLEKGQLRQAVMLASHYAELVYFAHALEILLHDVLEDEADAQSQSGQENSGVLSRSQSGGSIVVRSESNSSSLQESSFAPSIPENSVVDGIAAMTSEPMVGPDKAAVLPLVVEFLDHFKEALEVVVGCARKTEVARWAYLFNVVGEPRDLFEKCIAANELKTAGSYLLVLHNLEPLEESTAHTVRLLRLAVKNKRFALSKDLLRFVRSMDESGAALRQVVKEAALLPEDGDSQQRGSGTYAALNAAPFLSAGSPGHAPLLRSSSAPNVLDAMPEEDESEASSPSAQWTQPNSSNGNAPQQIRSVSLFGHRLGEGPPVPQLSVNGRIMASPSSPNAVSPTTPGSRRGSGQNGHIGLGMSLSRVGLRSTDKLFEPSQRLHNHSPT